MGKPVVGGKAVIVNGATPPSIVDALKALVLKRGGKTAVWVGDASTSWAELDAASTTLASGLKANGVVEGDFVTIGLPNSIDFISSVYAIWKLGAIPQPVSWRLPLHELRAIVELANSRVVIASDSLDVGSRVRTPAELRSTATPNEKLPDVISPSWKAPTSGGSTGRPKLIVSGSPAVLQEAGAALLRISADDIVVMPGPLYHNGPFITAFCALTMGAPVSLMPRFDAEETLRLIAERRATLVYFVPTMMSRIMKLPDEVRAKYDLSSLRTLWHMAAPCPPWVKQAWIDWVGPGVVWELYGGTEGVATTTIDGTQWLAHRGSVGTVYPGGDIDAFSADGRMLPRNEVGELYMRLTTDDPRPFRYVGAEDRWLDDTWFSIGDFGWRDDDGYIYLADRRSDLILIGGANVYPAEIEAVLDEHPHVRSSCVIGLPDDDLGARVHAIVQKSGDVDETTLLAFVAERLSKIKVPKSIEFVDEPLRDEAGKVRRPALREARIAKKEQQR